MCLRLLEAALSASGLSAVVNAKCVFMSLPSFSLWPVVLGVELVVIGFEPVGFGFEFVVIGFEPVGFGVVHVMTTGFEPFLFL